MKYANNYNMFLEIISSTLSEIKLLEQNDYYNMLGIH